MTDHSELLTAYSRYSLHLSKQTHNVETLTTSRGRWSDNEQCSSTSGRLGSTGRAALIGCDNVQSQ